MHLRPRTTTRTGIVISSPPVVAAETVERLLSHLAANGVTLHSNRITLAAVLAFDPARERFIDSPAADALLAREYRRGFEVREITRVMTKRGRG